MMHNRVYLRSRLPTPRVWFNGPRWRRGFGVTSEVLHAPEPSRPLMKRRYLFYDFEPDVRELVLEPLQFERVAMWTDPRERLGISFSVYRDNALQRVSHVEHQQ